MVENIMAFTACADDLAKRALIFASWDPDLAFEVISQNKVPS